MVDNYDDILDSRDIQERIEELEDKFLDEYEEFKEEHIEEFNSLIEDKTIEEDSDFDEWAEENLISFDDWVKEHIDYSEYQSLISLKDECEEYNSEWTYGATLIRESYFVDYCQEECEELGYVSNDLPFFIVINWEETAENMKVDYSEVDFDGVTYLIRNT